MIVLPSCSTTAWWEEEVISPFIRGGGGGGWAPAPAGSRRLPASSPPTPARFPSPTLCCFLYNEMRTPSPPLFTQLHCSYWSLHSFSVPSPCSVCACRHLRPQPTPQCPWQPPSSLLAANTLGPSSLHFIFRFIHIHLAILTGCVLELVTVSTSPQAVVLAAWWHQHRALQQSPCMALAKDAIHAMAVCSC